MIYIVQPVIPSYRVPLFEELAKRFDIEVHASPEIPDAPRNAHGLPQWAYTSHACSSLLRGRLLWQHGLRPVSDVLVINGNPRYLSSLWLAVRSRLRGAKVIWWGHGWSPTSVKWRAAVRYKLMYVANRLLLYTDDEAKNYRGLLPVFALNNTIDERPIKEAIARWTTDKLLSFKQDHGISGKQLLLFCGRLREECGLELAIAALRRLDSNYVLAVIGSGKQKFVLQSVAEVLGVEHRVWWIDESYSENEIAPWFLAARCLVYPGSIGLSLLHAFAYGRPVVTHSSISMHGPEIAALRDRRNGLLFTKGDQIDLACKIRRIDRERMGLEAIKSMRNFSIESMVNRFAQCISS